MKKEKTTITVYRRLSRKSQITIFIILAIIILFSVALYFYVQSSATKVRPPVEQLEVSDEVKPIQLYVTECLSLVSKDALIKLGNNGGYIDPTAVPGIVIAPQPYLSDALVFEPQIMPYWYYLKDNCENPTTPYGCMQTHKPFVCAKNAPTCSVASGKGPYSMEEQLNAYIEVHLKDCINDFKPFASQYAIKAGKIVADAQINDKDVSFNINYPLDITVIGSSKRITIPYFVTRHDVRLKDLYALSTDIYDGERNSTFLETMTLNLISVYSGIDSNLLPPMSGVRLFLGEKQYWVRSEVKTSLMDEVLPYLGFIQIVNAGNSKTIYGGSGVAEKYLPFEEGIYRNLQIKVSDNAYPQLDANIIYPYSDIYLRIGDSEIIKPKNYDIGTDSPIMKMMQLLIEDYQFKYDLSYPVIVRLKDAQAFNGEGYTFSYAMEANIRQNNPVKGNISVLTFGNGTSGVELDSEIHKPNRTITVETIDKHTRKPLDGVMISYRCGPQFVVGETALVGKRAVLSTRFPPCAVGGQIIYEKAGYMGDAIPFTNTEGTDAKKFTTELWPIVKKPLIILKRNSANVDAIQNAGAGAIARYAREVTPLSPNESVFLTIGKVKDNPLQSDVPLVGFLVYEKTNMSLGGSGIADQKAQINTWFTDGSINASTRDELLASFENIPEDVTTSIVPSNYTLEFVPGTYAIDAFMVTHERVHIPQEIRTFCEMDLGIVCAKKTSVTLKEQNFTAWINGGAKLDFTITENNVYEDSTIVLYVLDMPIPTTWSMIENTPTVESYQQGKTYLLNPRYE